MKSKIDFESNKIALAIKSLDLPGHSLSHEATGNAIPQTVLGVRYKSLASLARSFDLSKDLVSKRYSRGKRGLDLLPKKIVRKLTNEPEIKKGKIKVDGLVFPTITAACVHFDIKQGTFRKRRNEGKSIEQALGLVPFEDRRRTAKNKPKLRCKNSKVELHAFGKTYHSYSALARAFNLQAYVLYQRITVAKYSPEDAVTLPGKHKPISFNGIQYTSRSELARAYGITLELLTSRLKTKTLAQALGLEPAKTTRSIEFEGKHYSSLVKLARANNITYGKLVARLKEGMDLAAALMEKESVKNHGRYNKTILSRNKDLAEKAATLYLIQMNLKGKTYHKIGITTQSISVRLSAWSKFDCQIVKVSESTLIQAYELEQNIIKVFSHKRNHTIGADNIEGYTELLQLENSEIREVMDLMD